MAVLATSCSQDETLEVNSGNAISFRAFTNNVTRATEISSANLNDQEFALYAFQESSTPGLANSTLVWQDVLSYTNSAWNTSVTRYWPTASAMHFFAYNNDAISGGTANIAANAQTITDVKPAGTAAEQKDLLVAYNTGTYTQSNKADQAVQLNFKHAFAQVKVQAKNSGSLTVKVLGARIKACSQIELALIVLMAKT